MKCNNIEMYYEVAGKGAPIVLIHGLGGDLRMMTMLVRRLERAFSVISFDMRGSGRSDKPHGQYRIDMMADDTACLIKQLCSSPPIVLGFSMGGCVAMEMVAAHPGIAAGLVLVATLPSWQGPFPPSREVAELMRRTDISERLLRDVYDMIFGPSYKKRVLPEEYLAFRIHDEFPQPRDAYLSQVAALEAFDIRGRVESIEMRTLVVAGSADSVAPPANTRWLGEHIRGARVEMFEGIGHMVPVEAPGELAMAVCRHFPPRS